MNRNQFLSHLKPFWKATFSQKIHEKPQELGRKTLLDEGISLIYRNSKHGGKAGGKQKEENFL